LSRWESHCNIKMFRWIRMALYTSLLWSLLFGRIALQRMRPVLSGWVLSLFCLSVCLSATNVFSRNCRLIKIVFGVMGRVGLKELYVRWGFTSLPSFIVWLCFFLPRRYTFDFLSILAKKLTGKSVFDMTYLVSSGTLNLNSVNQSAIHILYSMLY